MFNVIKYVGSGHVQYPVFFPVDTLSFKHSENALTRRIVTAMNYRTH
jgi:hypothetical protein